MTRRNKLSMSHILIASVLCVACGSGGGPASTSVVPAQGKEASPSVAVVRVVSQKLDITVRLPGELLPYEVVAIYPKVTGFVKTITVDRGSRVKAGEVMARLEAPELKSQQAEAQAKVQSAESQLMEAESKLAADEGTYERLKAAAATPGVISGNELEIAQKMADADRARAKSLRENVNAAKQALQSVAEIEGYLRITAPFDGIVTERNVHPGALVGPAGGMGAMIPMLRVEQKSRLRLVVPVPESYVADISEGANVTFTVPAFPGETFNGKIARVAHSVEVKTRTMPVELDVMNPSGRLDAGMFPEVLWPVRRLQASLFVPPSAVVRTTERTFVVQVRDGKTIWVDVKGGASSGNLVEVFGGLEEGDEVAQRGTDELRPGTRVTPQLAQSKE